jgi:hypothetical protein
MVLRMKMQMLDAAPASHVNFPNLGGLEALILGSFVLVMMMLFHGVGLNRIIRQYKARAGTLLELQRSRWFAGCLFGWTTFLILSLHMIEVITWAAILNILGLTPDLHDSIYFCANSYTTLGLGDVLVPHAWREISPIMAMSGLFTFGFTTSVLFNLVGEHNALIEKLRPLLSISKRRK